MRHAPRATAKDDRASCPTSSLKQSGASPTAIVEIEVGHKYVTSAISTQLRPSVTTRDQETTTNGIDPVFLLHIGDAGTDEVGDLFREVGVELELNSLAGEDVVHLGRSLLAVD